MAISVPSNKKRTFFNRTLNLTVVLTLSFLSAVADAQTSTKKKTQKTDWSVFAETNPLECWSVAAPKKAVVTKNGRITSIKRDDILLMTSFRPSDKVLGQTGFTGGYPFAKGSAVVVAVGGKKFNFTAVGEWAWPSSKKEDMKVINAFKRGRFVTVTARSRRGTITQDTFSLRGYTAATEHAAKLCNMKLQKASPKADVSKPEENTSSPSPQYQPSTQ
jgi:hypothetical protein